MAILIPKTIGGCADKLYELKEKKGALNKQVALIEEDEKRLKEHVIQNLSKEESSGVSGKRAKVAVKVKDVPSVKDWELLYKHVLKTKDFSFFQRRVNDATIKEHWEHGETVPGVEVFSAVSVSVTKLS